MLTATLERPAETERIELPLLVEPSVITAGTCPDPGGTGRCKFACVGQCL